MATFSWTGDYGKYSAARHWGPRGVPGPGDTAVVANGQVVLRRQDVQATVLLGNSDPGAPPVLDLRNSSLSVLSMPDGLPQPFNNTIPIVPGYATVNVRGDSSIGAIDVGDQLNTNRASDPFGHGPVGAPETLTVNIAKGATLTAGFDIKYRTDLTINGGDEALFNATDSTIEGGKAVIHTPLGGQSTILMTNGPVEPTFSAVAGSLELGSSVGAGDTINVRMGHLMIDKPLEFLGRVDLFDNTDPAPGDRYSFGPQSILLKNIYATSFSFDDGSHVLTLFRGSDVLDQLRFTPGVTASFFEDSTALPGGTNVARTDNGVFIRGAFSLFPDNATVLPMQT